MDVFEKILSEIDKGIKTIEPLMRGETRQIAESQIIGLKEARKIVEKYKDDGWIPCSEKLPDKNDSYLVTIRSYDETASINYRHIDHGNSDGSFLRWGTKKPRTKRGEYIVAWMPLPDPYRTEECD